MTNRLTKGEVNHDLSHSLCHCGEKRSWRVYREYLQRESITVHHVSLGCEALAIARLSPPKVMVLDIRLPDINGLDVLDTIQSESIPTNVVVITAHGSVGLALNAITKGARDYLEKPFPVDRLLTTIRNELEHRRLHNLIDDVDSIRRSQYGKFIGSSLPMQAVCCLLSLSII